LLSFLSLHDNELSGCYHVDLHALCPKGFTNAKISDGNNFEADWEDLCAPTGLDECANGNLIICDTDCDSTLNNAENCFFELWTFYEELGGDGWTNNTGWLQNCIPCGDMSNSPWHGISCNADTQIVKIDLTANNLIGFIPSTINQLSHLEELLLDENEIKGDFPMELGELDSLYRLSVAANNLDGTLADAVGLLDSLRFLDLQNNKLTGKIPPGLNDNAALEQLVLSHNRFNDTIPDLSDLAALQMLDLDNNQLIGPMPSGLASSLVTLRLDSNTLTGPIPAYLGTLPNLDTLTAFSNQLSGCLPLDLSNKCNIAQFNFGDNPGLPNSGDMTQFCSSSQFGLCGTWHCDGTYAVIDDTPIANGTVKMQEFIQAAGTAQSPNLMVRFEAGDYIELLPGFKVEPNVNFEAVIVGCVN